MDHNEVIKNYAVERYLLGEMTAEERDRFEQHYFDCPDCLRELQTADVMKANLRAHLAELPKAGISTKRTVWAVAAALMLCLLGVGTYQNAVVIPDLRARLEAPQLLQPVVLRGLTRGAEVTVQADAPLDLQIGKLPGWEGFAEFRIECSDESGLKWARESRNPGPGLGFSLSVPNGFAPGRYSLAVYGLDSTGRSELGVYQLTASGG